MKQVLKGHERIEQDAFVKFRSHYSFDAQFCTVANGSEKGGVEGSVGFVRRNFLTPMPRGKSLEELNNYLLEKCLQYEQRVLNGQTRTIGELAQEEKPKLMPLMHSVYRNYTLHSAVVDKYLTVKVKNNRYSVPAGYRGKSV